MTATAAFAPRFELVSVPSPLVDRRALSQAWYDALHLSGSRESKARPLSLQTPRRGDAPEQRRSQAATISAARTAPSRASGARSGAGAPERAVSRPYERRRPMSALAATIVERLLARAAHRSIVLPIAEGRVFLSVRREAGGIRLVALCPSAARARVEAALAQARFALAATGMAIAW